MLCPQALPLLREVFDGHSVFLGREHGATQQAGLALASCLDALGHGAEAIELYREVAELRLSKLDALHSDRIYALDMLAVSLAKNGAHQEALPLLKESLVSHFTKREEPGEEDRILMFAVLIEKSVRSIGVEASDVQDYVSGMLKDVAEPAREMLCMLFDNYE